MWFYFFFFKQKTAYELRISYWSSGVCSSDLLSPAEGALIAGLNQRPSATDPYKAPELATARRDVVLDRMRENGFATDAEVEAARSTPLLLGSSVVPAAQHYAAPHLVEEVKQWILDAPPLRATPQARRDPLFGRPEARRVGKAWVRPSTH